MAETSSFQDIRESADEQYFRPPPVQLPQLSARNPLDPAPWGAGSPQETGNAVDDVDDAFSGLVRELQPPPEIDDPLDLEEAVAKSSPSLRQQGRLLSLIAVVMVFLCVSAGFNMYFVIAARWPWDISVQGSTRVGDLSSPGKANFQDLTVSNAASLRGTIAASSDGVFQQGMSVGDTSTFLGPVQFDGALEVSIWRQARPFLLGGSYSVAANGLFAGTLVIGNGLVVAPPAPSSVTSTAAASASSPSSSSSSWPSLVVGGRLLIAQDLTFSSWNCCTAAAALAGPGSNAIIVEGSVVVTGGLVLSGALQAPGFVNISASAAEIGGSLVSASSLSGMSALLVGQSAAVDGGIVAASSLQVGGEILLTVANCSATTGNCSAGAPFAAVAGDVTWGGADMRGNMTIVGMLAVGGDVSLASILAADPVPVAVAGSLLVQSAAAIAGDLRVNGSLNATAFPSVLPSTGTTLVVAVNGVLSVGSSLSAAGNISVSGTLLAPSLNLSVTGDSWLWNLTTVGSVLNFRQGLNFGSVDGGGSATLDRWLWRGAYVDVATEMDFVNVSVCQTNGSFVQTLVSSSAVPGGSGAIMPVVVIEQGAQISTPALTVTGILSTPSASVAGSLLAVAGNVSGIFGNLSVAGGQVVVSTEAPQSQGASALVQIAVVGAGGGPGADGSVLVGRNLSTDLSLVASLANDTSVCISGDVLVSGSLQVAADNFTSEHAVNASFVAVNISSPSVSLLVAGNLDVVSSCLVPTAVSSFGQNLSVVGPGVAAVLDAGSPLNVVGPSSVASNLLISRATGDGSSSIFDAPGAFFLLGNASSAGSLSGAVGGLSVSGSLNCTDAAGGPSLWSSGQTLVAGGLDISGSLLSGTSFPFANISVGNVTAVAGLLSVGSLLSTLPLSLNAQLFGNTSVAGFLLVGSSAGPPSSVTVGTAPVYVGEAGAASFSGSLSIQTNLTVASSSGGLQTAFLSIDGAAGTLSVVNSPITVGQNVAINGSLQVADSPLSVGQNLTLVGRTAGALAPPASMLCGSVNVTGSLVVGNTQVVFQSLTLGTGPLSVAGQMQIAGDVFLSVAGPGSAGSRYNNMSSLVVAGSSVFQGPLAVVSQGIGTSTGSVSVGGSLLLTVGSSLSVGDVFEVRGMLSVRAPNASLVPATAASTTGLTTAGNLSVYGSLLFAGAGDVVVSPGPVNVSGDVDASSLFSVVESNVMAGGAVVVNGSTSVGGSLNTQGAVSVHGSLSILSTAAGMSAVGLDCILAAGGSIGQGILGSSLSVAKDLHVGNTLRVYALNASASTAVSISGSGAVAGNLSTAGNLLISSDLATGSLSMLQGAPLLLQHGVNVSGFFSAMAGLTVMLPTVVSGNLFTTAPLDVLSQSYFGSPVFFDSSLTVDYGPGYEVSLWNRSVVVSDTVLTFNRSSLLFTQPTFYIGPFIRGEQLLHSLHVGPMHVYHDGRIAVGFDAETNVAAGFHIDTSLWILSSSLVFNQSSSTTGYLVLQDTLFMSQTGNVILAASSTALPCAITSGLDIVGTTHIRGASSVLSVAGSLEFLKNSRTTLSTVLFTAPSAFEWSLVSATLRDLRFANLNATGGVLFAYENPTGTYSTNRLLHISSVGNVGIGNGCANAPSATQPYQMEICGGTTHISGTTTVQAAMNFWQRGVVAEMMSMYASSSPGGGLNVFADSVSLDQTFQKTFPNATAHHYLHMQFATLDVLTIDELGNVAILNAGAVTNPMYALDLTGSLQVRGGVELTQITPGSAWLQFPAPTGTAGLVRVQIYPGDFSQFSYEVQPTSVIGGTNAELDGFLFRQTNGITVFTQQQIGTQRPDVVIRETGRVGFNTLTPGYTLEVNGKSRITGNLYIYEPLIIMNKDTNSIYFDHNSGSMQWLDQAAYVFQLTTAGLASADIQLHQPGTMLISHVGDVGINFSPGQSSLLDAVLHVNADMYVAGQCVLQSGSVVFQPASSPYYSPRLLIDGGPFQVTIQYSSNPQTILYLENSAGGSVFFGTGPAVAFASSGNVGVNTAAPSYKLDVSGTGYLQGNVIVDGTLAFAHLQAAALVYPSAASGGELSRDLLFSQARGCYSSSSWVTLNNVQANPSLANAYALQVTFSTAYYSVPACVASIETTSGTVFIANVEAQTSYADIYLRYNGGGALQWASYGVNLNVFCVGVQ